MVLRISVASVAATAVLVGGCAFVSPRSGGGVPDALCEPAIADAVMGSTRQATAAARASLVTSISDARGFLTSQGYRRFRVSESQVRCARYELFPGLYRCIATAQVCGRRR